MKFFQKCLPLYRQFHTCKDKIVISQEVKDAVARGRGTVALESTVITHGMPYPENLQTALQLEQIIREENCIPATIAVLDGSLRIGLSEAELGKLAKLRNPLKISRRDISVALSNGFSGGTTVSATLFGADRAKISVFATGGIGGVHRGVEESFDISADLKELGRTPVAVVSAGVKSILDVRRTLEYLETEGVTVISIGTDVFPGFFVPRSNFKPQFSVKNAAEAAKILAYHKDLNLLSGILFAVPIPDEEATNAEIIEATIQSSLEAAKTMSITGKDITPFVLDCLNEHTGGMSLRANIALIKNNARTAGRIAFHLATMSKSTSTESTETVKTPVVTGNRYEKKTVTNPAESKPQIVVVGGVTADFYSKPKTDVTADGGTYECDISQSYGGVGRNHADGLSRLGTDSLLISCVGADQTGRNFAQLSQLHLKLSGIKLSDQLPTATYIGILSQKDAGVRYGLMDSRIFSEISPDLIRLHEEEIAASNMVIMDGNIPKDTMKFLCQLCNSAGIPVWFEPTDKYKLAKLFEADCLPLISYLSPNQSELMALLQGLQIKHSLGGGSVQPEADLTALSSVFQRVFEEAKHLKLLRMTFGPQGCTIINKTNEGQLKGITLSPSDTQAVVNSSGAGDSWNCGLIHGITRDWPLIRSASLGLLCANESLQSHHPISPTLSPLLVESLKILQPDYEFEL